jgi:cobaltochelatase CobT
MFRRFLRRREAVGSVVLDESPRGYRVYTRAHVEIVTAQHLLKHYRHTWAIKLAGQDFRASMAPQISALTTQAILAAGHSRVDTSLRANPLITVLIDLSGSMRGVNAQLAALTVEGISAFAETNGSGLEVLGFTTVDWHGKPARTDWLRNGKPPNPGRLCALRHVVFRSFDSRSSQGLDLLFAHDFFRENVDGEAIEWALQRLRAAESSHRLLIYVSDGAPVDDSTLACNSADFLWQHLRNVLETARQAKAVRIAAIGLSHDVTNLVPGAIAVRTFDEIREKLIPFLSAQFVAAVANPET